MARVDHFADPEALQAVGIVELISSQRAENLRNAGRQGLRGGADAAVMYRHRRPGKELLERRVGRMFDEFGQFGRNLPGIRGDQVSAAFQSPATLDRGGVENFLSAGSASGRENDRAPIVCCCPRVVASIALRRTF